MDIGSWLSVVSSRGFCTLEHCTGGFQPTDSHRKGKEHLKNWAGKMVEFIKNRAYCVREDLSSTPSWLWQCVPANLVQERQGPEEPRDLLASLSSQIGKL